MARDIGDHGVIKLEGDEAYKLKEYPPFFPCPDLDVEEYLGALYRYCQHIPCLFDLSH